MAQKRSIEEKLNEMADEVHCQEEIPKQVQGLLAVAQSYVKIPYLSEKESREYISWFGLPNAQKKYENCVAIASSIDYDKDDIEAFANRILYQIENELHAPLNPSTGLYISALINNLPESQEITIRPGNLCTKIALNHIGHRMGEKHEHSLHLYGVNADYIAQGMVKGEVYVNDSISIHLGRDMEGGYIEAPNCQDFVGAQMKGGEIYLKRYTLIGPDGRTITTSRGFIGLDMSGGKITVEGDCSSLGDNMRGGEIYVSGDVGFLGGSRGLKGGYIVVEGDAETTLDDFAGAQVTVKGELKKRYFL